MNTVEELDIITRMRGEVMSRQDVTGENLFLAWGYPTVLVMGRHTPDRRTTHDILYE